MSIFHLTTMKVNRLAITSRHFSTAGEAIASDVNGKFNNDLENIQNESTILILMR